MSGARRIHHSISGLFTFVLIGLFALFALAIVVSGVQSYRGMATSAQLSSEKRIALGYVSGKLRASGDRSAVTLRTQGGEALLVIAEDIDGERYETRIYYSDGSLREQFCEAGLPFSPEDGEAITALPGFRFERSGDLITLRAALSDGTEAVTSVALRAGEGGGRDAL